MSGGEQVSSIAVMAARDPISENRGRPKASSTLFALELEGEPDSALERVQVSRRAP